jgi:hypothetical protein
VAWNECHCEDIAQAAQELIRRLKLAAIEFRQAVADFTG